MPKISVVVPIYNTQEYLVRCIESVLNQTFKDIEIILVNDGSTDESGIICNQYSEKYKNVKVIHKLNGGLSDARNEGIKVATGDYIGFVDSDDIIEKEMYKVLYSLCIQYNADISTCLFESIEYGKKSNKTYSNKVSIFTNKEAVKNTYEGTISGYSVCNKLYKRELLNEIKFPKGRIYEDASILYKLYMNSNRVVYIESALYKYVRREGSITKSMFSDKRFDIVSMFEEKYNYMSINYPEMCEKIKSMYYISLRNIIIDIVNENSIKENYKSIKRVSEIIRSELMYILKNTLISRQHKILAIILAYFPKMSIRLYRIRIDNIDNLNA
ncbi:MAG: glycosyltransferase [Terrisporobacter othiniensis]|nr:glycosyltransferase [Terrisporobacter othiniensis]MDU6996759.1 glycosyltransferase [Terrisporobacter othiniensis]